MSESNRLLEAREPRRAGNEPKRERPRGDRRLILLAARQWLKHQLDLLNRGLEGHHRMDWHSKMGHDHAVAKYLVTNRHVPEGFEGEGSNTCIVAKGAYPVGINERCARAADAGYVVRLARNDLGDDWRLCAGFIGHDGLPRSFNPQSGEWDLTAPLGCAKEAARSDGGLAMSKSQHGKHVANVQRKIARHLNRGEMVPPGLAQALAALLWKEQRSRLGHLQNMRKLGELR